MDRLKDFAGKVKDWAIANPFLATVIGTALVAFTLGALIF